MGRTSKRSGQAQTEARTKKTKDSNDATAAGQQASASRLEANDTDVIVRTPTPRPPHAECLVLLHWNIAGLNGLLSSEERRERLRSLVTEESPDVLALSEHKLSEDKVEKATLELLKLLPGYCVHWAICTAKKGYSGLGVLVKVGLEVHEMRTKSHHTWNNAHLLHFLHSFTSTMIYAGGFNHY